MCPKWRVTLNEKKLKQYDRYIWAKELWKLPKRALGYYGKYNEVKSRDKGVTVKFLLSHPPALKMIPELKLKSIQLSLTARNPGAFKNPS